MANIYGATSLIGGGAEALDIIDGAILNDGDVAVVVTSTESYHYYLDATSGAAENSPFIIAPDTNPGTKRWLLRQPRTTTIPFDDSSAPTHGEIKTMHDYVNHIGSSAATEGFDITDLGTGQVTIDPGAALLRDTTDLHTSIIKEYDVTGGTTGVGIPSIADGSTVYIFANYNAGSPQLEVYTSIPTDAGFTEVPLWFITRAGTVVHYQDMRNYGLNYNVANSRKDFYVNGYEHARGGSIIGYSNRNITLTSGSFFLTSIQITHPAYDTSGADRFTYYYRNGSGGWTEVSSVAQIDNTQYDNGTGTLATISNPTYYGVHWVFLILDAVNHLIVVYGQQEFSTLAAAQAATIPTILPPILNVGGLGNFVGKVIIQRDATTINSVQSPFTQALVSGSPTGHNDLSGLQGGIVGQYYHLTSSNHSNLTGGSPTFSALNLTTDTTGKVNFGTGTDMDIYYTGSIGQINTNLVAASDLHVNCGTQKTIVLDQPVYDDIFPTAVTVAPGPNAPAITAYNGNLQAHEFLGTGTTNTEMGFTFQFPHDYKEGTDFSFHLHLWVPDDVTGGDIVFHAEYDQVELDGSPSTPATASATLTRGASAGANGNAMITFTDISGTGMGMSSTFQVFIYRDPDGGTPSDTFGASVWLLSVDCHIQKDTMGSRQRLSK